MQQPRIPMNTQDRSPENRHRRGLIVLELVIVLPVILIFLAAAIEFGLIICGIQQVEMASRAGAKIAAEDATLGTAVALPAAVKSAVDRVLASGAIGVNDGSGNACNILLRHNVPPTTTPLISQSPFTCPCNSPTSNLPASPPYYVRVTVCVELSKLTPNLLGTFGFSTANKYVECTTTNPYEPSP